MSKDASGASRATIVIPLADAKRLEYVEWLKVRDILVDRLMTHVDIHQAGARLIAAELIAEGVIDILAVLAMPDPS